MAVDFRAAFAQILAKLDLLKTAVQNNTFFELVGGTVIKLKDAYTDIVQETGHFAIKATGLAKALNLHGTTGVKLFQNATNVIWVRSDGTICYYAMRPAVDGTTDLGTATKYWSQAFLKNSIRTPLAWQETVDTDMSGPGVHIVEIPHTVPDNNYEAFFTVETGHVFQEPLGIEVVTLTKTITDFDIEVRDGGGNLIDCSVNNLIIGVQLIFKPAP